MNQKQEKVGQKDLRTIQRDTPCWEVKLGDLIEVYVL